MSILPSPPFQEVDGISNFRDAGGYPLPASAGASSIRRHFIYRCADPSRITPAGEQKIKELKITTIFDLRSNPEIKNQQASGFKTGISNLPGVQHVSTPAFAEVNYDPASIALRYQAYSTGGAEGFTRAYADILDNAGPSFRTILLHVRDKPAEPFVVHCSAGKDRTGVIVAIMLSLAGAEDEVVADEYELTTAGLGLMRDILIDHLLKTPSLGGDRSKAERMVSSDKEFMLSTLKYVREKYGSMTDYVKQNCGLTDADIAVIRRNLQSQDKPVVGLGLDPTVIMT